MRRSPCTQSVVLAYSILCVVVGGHSVRETAHLLQVYYVQQVSIRKTFAMTSSFSMTIPAVVFACSLCFQYLPLTRGAPDSLYSIPELSKAQVDLFEHPRAAIWYNSLNKESPLKTSSNVIDSPTESESDKWSPSIVEHSEGSIGTFYENTNSAQFEENSQTFNISDQSIAQPSDAKKQGNVSSVLLDEHVPLSSPASTKSPEALDDNLPTSVNAKVGLHNGDSLAATFEREQLYLRNDSGSPASDSSAASPHLDRLSAAPAKFECVEKIFLWTNEHKRGQEYELFNDIASVKLSHFVPGAKTYVIFHGFMSDGLQPWIMQMKDKLLRRETCNVISVQWWAGNTYADYYRVADNYVDCTAQETLGVLTIAGELKQLRPSSLHLIGHSLGAHVAGFVGKKQHRIGRITGLDPAGLTYRNTDKSVRLDKTDADYVDVIHTNGCTSTWNPWGDCFGISDSIGHTDFWPNGGQYQPACRKLQSAAAKDSDRGMAGAVGCDHQMSYKYFIESLDYGTSTRRFLSRYASSYQVFNYGNASCGTSIQYMGFFADHESHGNHFLDTSSVAPYAYLDTGCLSREGLNLRWISILSAYFMLGITFLISVIPALIIAAPMLAASASDLGGRVIAHARAFLGRIREDEVPIVEDQNRTEQEDELIGGEDESLDFHSQAASSDYESQPESDGN